MAPQITTFLLQQLLKTWHPDVKALTERTPNVLSKTPKLHPPPLVAVLASLGDTPATAHKPAGKELPCGHRVEISSILTAANLFGDRIWGKGRGPSLLECPLGCDFHYALPVLPAPWAVDGLQARLDLIQWLWAQGKDAPDGEDVKAARILRVLLTRIGHAPRDWEMTASSPSGRRRLKQALELLLDSDAVVEAAAAAGKAGAGARSLRGAEPYCRFRAFKALSRQYAPYRYVAPSPGQYCRCDEPHPWSRLPREWASTPAEDGEERRFVMARSENVAERRKETKKEKTEKKKKKVRFAAPVVTRIHYFEPWWRREYRDSGRYYSKGPAGTSRDRATRVDDEREVERLESVGARGWVLGGRGRDQKAVVMTAAGGCERNGGSYQSSTGTRRNTK